MRLIRASRPSEQAKVLYEAGLCLVVQGRKQARLGGEVFRYDPLNYLVVSVTLPIIGQVIEASPRRPFLCVRRDVNPRDIAELLLQADARGAVPPPDRGLHLGRITRPMTDALARLLELLATPQDASVLGPLVIREIFYRVLTGEIGPRLRDLVVADSRGHRVARAIDLIKDHYQETVRVEELAEAVHMSPSALHRHFKAVTTLSPLQFQKQLRLHEARRLMLTEGLNAVTAGHHVGYQSPSQFSREYRRMFGAPPRVEIGRGRGLPVNQG